MARMVRGVVTLVTSLVLSLGTAVGGEAAAIFSFSGSGTLGNAAPVPLTWLVTSATGGGAVNQWYWSIPGFGEGETTGPSEVSVTDFHITFEARTADAEPVPDSDFFDSQFRADGILWTAVINGNTVDFFAPAGTSLDQRERFVVNVALQGGEGIRTFEAHWTTAAVPMPATVVLLASAAGLGAARAWRRG